MKIRRQITDYNETIIKHILKPKMTEIIKNILKPKMTDCNETIIKNIFKHKYFQTLNVGSCVPYAMVHRSVLQCTRGERVQLSLYKRTFVVVLHFHFMHSKDDRKGDGFFRFQTITGAQLRFFFFYSYNAFPHFVSTFSIRPSSPSLFHCPTGHESRRF